MPTRSRQKLLVSALLVALHACSPDEEPRGELMIVVSADAAIPKDVNQVAVEVLSDKGNQQRLVYPILPELLGKAMPGTLAIVPPNAGGQHVRVRLIAERDRGTGDPVEARVVREAVLNVPTDRVAMLPMPLRWLCDGVTKTGADGRPRSDCADDETCVAGHCETAVIDTGKLETYDRAKATGDGTCIDVAACFADSVTTAPDDDCTLPVPAGMELDNVNVALVPANGDGICGAEPGSECFVLLDHHDQEGWKLADGRIQLPPAACERLGDGRVRDIRLTTACQSKDLSLPICGPWSPGSKPRLVNGGDGGAAGAGDLGGAGGTGGTAPGKTGAAGKGGSSQTGVGGTNGDAGAGAGEGAGASGGSTASGGGGGTSGSGAEAGTGAAAGEAGAGGTSPFTEFPLGGTNYADELTLGPDGALWFTDQNQLAIGRMTPAGTVAEYGPTTSYPRGIAEVDGELWFGEWSGNLGAPSGIGRITTSGVITEYPLPGGGDPSHVIAGPDGNIWYLAAAAIGRITPGGAITEFPLPRPTGQGDLTVGSDGNIWLSEAAGPDSQLVRVDVQGNATSFPVQAPNIYALFDSIITGPDGKLWFIDSYYGQFYTMTTAGVVAPVPMQGMTPTKPVVVPDDTLWFFFYQTEGRHGIGHITTDGELTLEDTEIGGRPFTLGPDQNLWFSAGPSLYRYVTPEP